MQLTPEQKQRKLEKIQLFTQDNARAVFGELMQINETLKEIAEKPEVEIPEVKLPEPVEEVSVKNLPSIQRVEITNQKEPKETKIDLSETNKLLKKLVDKDNEQIEVSVKLNLV